MINEWLNDKYINKKQIAIFKKEFSKSKPFSHIKLNNFLKEDKLKEVAQALSKESFDKKDSDLFSLNQTNDFKTTNNQILKKFRDFLSSKEMVSIIEEITCEKLIVNAIDCNGSVYKKNDYLLAHDDKLDSRKIAFIFYLSDFDKKDGGSLDLYKCSKRKPINVEKSIFPKTNSFVFFKVSDISFHQVSEVITNKTRISINGWYHGK